MPSCIPKVMIGVYSDELVLGRQPLLVRALGRRKWSVLTDDHQQN